MLRSTFTRKRLRALETLERRELLAAQGLDPTFGTGGVVEQTIPGTASYADTVAIQPDGKIVVGGAIGNVAPNGYLPGNVSSFLLTRYNADGTPDLSFGTNVTATTNDPRFQNVAAIHHVVVESNGKLQAISDGGLLRFNADGTLDTNFGYRGLPQTERGNWVEVLSDGKILTAGLDINRYNSDGTPDRTFGNGGDIVASGSPFQFIVTSDEKIVAAAKNVIERFTADGKFDTSFGNGGVVQVAGPGIPAADGTPLVVADGDKYDWIGDVSLSNQQQSHDAIEVVRFNSDGTIDTTFGNNGQMIITSAEPITDSFSAVLQSDGKLLIAGRSGTIAGSVSTGAFDGNIFTARLDANGALDPTWGTGGMLTISIGSSSEALAAAETSDGQIVLVGDAVPLNATTQTHELVVVRLSGTPNQEFIQGAFRDLLDRAADPAALDYLATQLDNGAVSRSQVVQILQSSGEYDANIVRGVYTQFLKRPVDPTGLSSWTTFLQSGGTREQLEAQILASGEFYNQVSGGDPDKFLSNLYQDLLHRPTDATARTYFGLELSGGVSRDRVVEAVLASPEFDQVTVNSLYLEFLGRPADPTGLAVFDAQLAKGASPDQIIAQIVASDEYFEF